MRIPEHFSSFFISKKGNAIGIGVFIGIADIRRLRIGKKQSE
jgi:hypothetical protein